MKWMHPSTELDELFLTYLDSLYQGTTGFVKDLPSGIKPWEDESVCDAYGELLFPSVVKLLNEIDVQPEDCFLDMGSGLGKLALMAFYYGPMQHVLGIEAVLPTFETSAQKLEQFKVDCHPLFQGLRTLNLQYGNFLTANLSEVTIAYCCSTCFSPQLLANIGDKINQTPSIRYLLSLRPIPTLTRLPFLRVVEVECSWDSALCYVYGKK